MLVKVCVVVNCTILLFVILAIFVEVSALPVKLPVTLPSKLATKVATVYPVADVSTVVNGFVVKPVNSLNLSSLASLNNPLYLVPLETYLPNNPMSNIFAALFTAN